ncbi:MAG: tetratricopeptide repeat protein [Deltaproteobacteria bacterium]|nr:tetratricopeptide repeat protein [Deltaproteobacteria bacterium]
MSGRIKYIVFIFCVLSFLPVQGYGKTLAGLVKDGNKSYNAGDYDTAVASYDRALTEDPDSPYAYFNKGAALYKKGDYTGAKEAFETAALKGMDPHFEAETRFNLGNTEYKEAEALMETDLQKALEGCSESVGHFQEALRLDPDMKEAAQNMEMVRLVMKNILDEIQKQEESGREEQEKKEQAAEKLKEIIKEQESALEENRQLQKEQAEKGNSGGIEKKTQDLADKQHAIRDKTEALSKEWPKDSGQDNASDEAPVLKHLENAVKEQDAAGGNLDLNNIKEAEKNQDDAIEELKEALDSLEEDGNKGAGKEDKDQQDKQQGQQQQASSPDESQKDASDQAQEQVSAAEVSDDARDILNDEKENKEKRRAVAIGGYKEVEKDW